MIVIPSIFIALFALCWGSFLNMLAYRLIADIPLLQKRSSCPHCKTKLAWYDLIPIISWLMISGRCRFCNKSISLLYPLIELASLVTFVSITLFVPHHYLLGSWLFTSALLITLRTDLEHMVISRFATLFLIPIFIILSYFGLTALTIQQSIAGSLTGYLSLFLVRHIHYLITGKIGMGQGDIELLAMFGSFLGIIGWWTALIIGSLTGSIIGIALCLQAGTLQLKIPFGPFLVIGAFITQLILYNPSWLTLCVS